MMVHHSSKFSPFADKDSLWFTGVSKPQKCFGTSFASNLVLLRPNLGLGENRTNKLLLLLSMGENVASWICNLSNLLR